LVERRRRSTDPPDAVYDHDGFQFTLPGNLGTVSGKGWLSLIALFLIGIFTGSGLLIYMMSLSFREIRVEFQQLRVDHANYQKSVDYDMDRLACVLTLTLEERKEFARHGATWATICPYLMRDSGRP